MRKVLINLVAVVGIGCMASLSQANPTDQVDYLQAQDEMFKDVNELIQVALSSHAGSKVREGSKLKRVYGRYIYRVALLDIRKIRWNVDLDAQTGEIVSNMID